MLRRRIAFVIDRSLLLIAGTALALVWANTLPDSYRAFSESMFAIVDDIGMVFFFGLATKEIVEATRPGGALASKREAAVPLLAAGQSRAPPTSRSRTWLHGSFLRRGIPRFHFCCCSRLQTTRSDWSSLRCSIRFTPSRSGCSWR